MTAGGTENPVIRFFQAVGLLFIIWGINIDSLEYFFAHQVFENGLLPVLSPEGMDSILLFVHLYIIKMERENSMKDWSES